MTEILKVIYKIIVDIQPLIIAIVGGGLYFWKKQIDLQHSEDRRKSEIKIDHYRILTQEMSKLLSAQLDYISSLNYGNEESSGQKKYQLAVQINKYRNVIHSLQLFLDEDLINKAFEYELHFVKALDHNQASLRELLENDKDLSKYQSSRDMFYSIVKQIKSTLKI